MNSLPVTIVSGFPGAGKSAVIQCVVKESPGLKIGVISNDVPAENLLSAAMNQAATGNYDYLLIEAPGDSEPMLVAEALSLHADGEEESSGLRIDTMVTVVDAQNFVNDFQSVEEFRDRSPESDTETEDDRDIARVLIEQIEFANVILLNKTDLLSEEEVGQLLAVLRKLNPDARVLEIEKGYVSADEVINTGRYQSDSAAADVWQSVLTSDETGSEDEFGISSIVYRARRPFHPQRFWDFWMDGEHAPNILRSKGYFWLATKNSIAGVWSHVGQVLAAEPGGSWWAETPRAEWPTDDPELMTELNSVWDEVWGDRRQELILIGQDLDAAAARKALDGCLLTDSEMESGPASWSQLEDPFGCWQAGHDCDGSHDHDHG